METRNRTTKINTALFTGLITSLFLVASAHAQQPIESGAGQICGTLRSFHGEIQVFDYTRTHLGESAFGTKLRCGDWVSVDQGKAVIEHVNGTGVLVSANSFIQILDPQSGANPEHAHVALYRGEFLIQAGKEEVRIVTPNAMGRVEKGSAFVVYSSSSEESQIVGLGGRATLENRFFSEKAIRADFAYMVSFANPVERLIPEQGRPVNAKELNARLTLLGVADSVQETIEKASKYASKVRMPVSLAPTELKSTLMSAHSPETITRPVAKVAPLGTRAPASIRPRVSKPLLRKVAEEPDFRLGRHDQEAKDRQKLIQALSSIRPDDE